MTPFVEIRTIHRHLTVIVATKALQGSTLAPVLWCETLAFSIRPL